MCQTLVSSYFYLIHFFYLRLTYLLSNHFFESAKKLGEQCFYDQTCMHNDINSLCIQIRHNALCQCVHGYHSVSYSKPTKRVFCTEGNFSYSIPFHSNSFGLKCLMWILFVLCCVMLDMSTLTSDLPTLLGVSTGIAVLAGLICMVLHLFTKTKYPRHRHFNDNNLPPIMYSSDTGKQWYWCSGLHFIQFIHII